jgi:hypothetical protein
MFCSVPLIRLYLLSLYCILVAFANLRKATVSSVMSVRPVVSPHRAVGFLLDGFCWSLIFDPPPPRNIFPAKFNVLWFFGFYTARGLYHLYRPRSSETPSANPIDTPCWNPRTTKYYSVNGQSLKTRVNWCCIKMWQWRVLVHWRHMHVYDNVWMNYS